MWIPVLKVLAAIAAALILILIASRKLRPRPDRERVLRSLPGNMVQEIADLMDSPDELTAYLKGFFGRSSQGAEQPVENAQMLRSLLPAVLPEEEFADLLRTAGAIEPDSLLAYACRLPGNGTPAVITVCRNGGKPGLLVGVFRPVE